MAQAQLWWDPMSPTEEKGNSNLPTVDLDIKPLPKDKLPPEDDKDSVLTRRIHLLGLGSIGTLVGHALRNLSNPPPITLIMHRPEMYESFKEGARILRLINKQTEVVDEQTGYDVDVIEDVQAEKAYWVFEPHYPDGMVISPEEVVAPGEMLESGETFIYTLIVTVKGPATVRALKSVKHRVDERTTILLMQNGLGQVDLLNTEVFPDPATRPTYMLGIISHGAFMQRSFNVVHAGFGTIALGIYRDPDKYPLPPKDPSFDATKLDEFERKKLFPTDIDLYANSSSRYLLRTLTRSTVLACAPFPYLDLFQLQLEKLVANCIINPLTALLDIQNGGILDNPPLTRVERLLLAEISLVLRQLPELANVPNIRQRFSTSRLEQIVRNNAKKTSENSSSMREDVRHAKLTEIDYINGYIVKRGEQQGVKCVLNYMIMQLVKSVTFGQMKDGRRHGEKKIMNELGTLSLSRAGTFEDISSPAVGNDEPGDGEPGIKK